MRVVNHLSRLVRDLAQDAELRADFARDPHSVAAGYGLTPSQLEALTSGDDTRIRGEIAGRTECFIIATHPIKEESEEAAKAA